MEQMGDRIKRIRKSLNLTQNEMAEKIGATAGSVGMYEQNRREPRFEQIKKISELLGVTTDYLIYGTQVNTLESPVIRKKANDDFADILNNLEKTLMEQKGLMFKGEVLNDGDIEKIFEAMKIGAEVAIKSKK